VAIVNFTGFETGDASELYYTSGTVSIQGTVKRTGSYALRTNPTTTGKGSALFGGLDATGAATVLNLAAAYPAFYFQWHVCPGAGSEEDICQPVDYVGSFSCRVTIHGTDHKLRLYDISYNLIGTSTTALTIDTWYRIEIGYVAGSPGSLELKINGTSEVSGAATASAFGAIYLGKTANLVNATVDYFYDDACIDDAGYRGAGQCFRMAPAGNGAYTAWDNDWDEVEEVPHDSGTSIISTSTSLAAETVTLVSAASSGLVGTPLAAKSLSICAENASFSSAFQTRLRSGTTNNDTTSRNMTTTYAASCKVYVVDPADSGAWTAAKLNALEVGVEANNASGQYNCTALCVMVWEDGVPPAVVNYSTVAGSFTPVGLAVKNTLKPPHGALSPAGVVKKAPRRTLAGGFTSAGGLGKAGRRLLAGTITPAGGLVRGARRVLAGTLTSSGTAVKGARRALAGAVTSAGGLVRRTGRSLAAGLTSGGTVTRRAAHALGGTLASAGDLVGTLLHGGVLFYQTVAGALSASGTLARRTSHMASGAVTSAGSLIRRASRVLLGTATLAGAVIRQPRRLVAGTATASGAIQRAARKATGGSLVTSGTLVRLTAYLLAGTLASAGSLTRRTVRVLSGTLTSAGALVASKIAHLYYQVIGGTLTAAGVLTRFTARTLTGTVASSGGLARRTSRVIAGVLSSTGGLARQTRRIIAGTLSSAGALAIKRMFARILSGTLTLTGTAVRSAIKPLRGTLTSSGAVIVGVRQVFLGGVLAVTGTLFGGKVLLGHVSDSLGRGLAHSVLAGRGLASALLGGRGAGSIPLGGRSQATRPTPGRGKAEDDE